MHAVISKQITIKSGKIIWNIAHERIYKHNEHMRGTNMLNKYLHENGDSHNPKTYFINPFMEFEDFLSFFEKMMFVIGLKKIK